MLTNEIKRQNIIDTSIILLVWLFAIAMIVAVSQKFNYDIIKYLNMKSTKKTLEPRFKISRIGLPVKTAFHNPHNLYSYPYHGSYYSTI